MLTQRQYRRKAPVEVPNSRPQASLGSGCSRQQFSGPGGLFRPAERPEAERLQSEMLLCLIQYIGGARLSKSKI